VRERGSLEKGIAGNEKKGGSSESTRVTGKGGVGWVFVLGKRNVHWGAQRGMRWEVGGASLVWDCKKQTTFKEKMTTHEWVMQTQRGGKVGANLGKRRKSKGGVGGWEGPRGIRGGFPVRGRTRSGISFWGRESSSRTTVTR